MSKNKVITLPGGRGSAKNYVERRRAEKKLQADSAPTANMAPKMSAYLVSQGIWANAMQAQREAAEDRRLIEGYSKPAKNA